MIRGCVKLLALGLISTVCLGTSPAQAQNDYEALYNRYLYHYVGVPARSAAMGGAYTALKGGDMALYGNPASLGFQKDTYLSVKGGLRDVSSDSSLDIGGFSDVSTINNDLWDAGLGLVYPFEWGALSVSYDYSKDEADSDSFNILGSRFKTSSELERHTISLGGGYSINECWAIGYRYSFITWDRDSVLRDVGAFVPTTVASWSDDFDGHRNHFGTQYEYGAYRFGLDGMFGLGDSSNDAAGDSDRDEWGVRGGAAYDFSEQFPMLVTLDLSFDNRDQDGGGFNNSEDLFGVHVGAEYEAVENLFVRAGYMYEDYSYDDDANAFKADAGISGYTAGLGYSWNQFTLDYGFMFMDVGGDGDLVHVFNIGYHF
ncbi:MAG: hypothetical protein GC154_17220 [bacterium]|nr:hypothetical protein [bacterium]